MWNIANRTPYEAERTWVQDEDGARQWVVVVKATFDIAKDGSLSLSDAPVAPLHAPVYSGKDGDSSLVYEADMIPAKPGTDVYLRGHAYAPGGRPTLRTTVSLSISSSTVAPMG